MSLSQSFSQKIGNVRPLNPCPSLDIDFANGGYVNTGGFANQESVGSANFKIGAFNGPDPIFTRATAATFRGSNGLIQYAPENLLQYSEQFNNPAWTLGAAFVTANATTAPDGTTTADKIDLTAAVNSRITQSIAVPNTTMTLSVWIRSDSALTVLLGNTLSNDSSINVTTSWQRFVWTGILASGTQLFGIRNGEALAKTIYIWGAQLERHSTARPYISTTTTARYGPRFEYDLSGNPLGLLMEEQSQNLVWYGNSLETTGSKWQGIASGAASSITLNSTTSPTGIANSASLLTFNTAVTGAGSYSTWRQNYVTTTSGTYTFSVWLRSGSNSSVYIRINDSTGNKGKLLCNLTTSWQRFVITSTTSGTITGVSADIGADGNAGETMTAGNIYVWGAQLEQKPFVTSYMPTVGGTSTRNADVVSSTISSWFNQTEGTVVVSGDRNNNPTLNSTGQDSFFEFTGTASYLLVHACDGTTEAVYDAAGSPATTVGVTIGSLTSIAASYSDTTDLLHISRNGLTTQSGPSTGLGVAPTTLNIGYAPSNSIGYWNGHIKSFRYFPKALPNNLQRLSS